MSMSGPRAVSLAGFAASGIINADLAVKCLPVTYGCEVSRTTVNSLGV
jgi:hypothetical protein